MAGLGGIPKQAADHRKGPMRRTPICLSTDRRPPAELELNPGSCSTSTIAGMSEKGLVFGTGSEATMAVGVGSTTGVSFAFAMGVESRIGMSVAFAVGSNSRRVRRQSEEARKTLLLVKPRTVET